MCVCVDGGEVLGEGRRMRDADGSRMCVKVTRVGRNLCGRFARR